MINKHIYHNITWVDVDSPTAADIDELNRDYGINRLVRSELMAPTLRPKVDLYKNFIYLVLHFPIFNHPKGEKDNQEVDFLVGKDFIITVHYESLQPMHEIKKIFQTEDIIDLDGRELHAGFLLFFIIRHIYESLEIELDVVTKELEQIERYIFGGEEHTMVRSISLSARRLLHFRISLQPHKQTLLSLEEAGKKFFGDDYVYYITSISNEWYKIWTTLENHKESLEMLRATNDSLLSTRTNDTMKFLTIMAFVTFPLSLLASIFGMNTNFLPIVGHRFDFWIIIGIMAVGTAGFFGFFKYKKWL